MSNFTLVNVRMGGFTFVTFDQAIAWQNNPEAAVTSDEELMRKLHSQTLNKGFEYTDFALSQYVQHSNTCLRLVQKNGNTPKEKSFLTTRQKAVLRP